MSALTGPIGLPAGSSWAEDEEPGPTGRPHTLTRAEEAVVLALAVTVPLAFNPVGVLAFEPFKLTLVRVAGLVLVLVWAAGGMRRGDTTSRLLRSPARPLVVAVGLFLASTALASIVSVHPLASVLGSYDRLQGLVTQLALAAVALAAARSSRPTRLVDALLLSSAPICGYALLQQFGLDPFPWLDRPFGPPSTVGSSTALGGFLAMLAPLTLSRAAIAAREMPATGSLGSLLRDGAAWRYAGLVALAGLHTVVVVLTGVRGALLGLLVGLGVFALALLARGGGARRAWTLLATVAGGVLALALLNVPVGPLERLRDLSPHLERLGSIGFEETSGRERLLIWAAGAETWARSGPRLLVGFGPETQAPVFEGRLPVEIANRLPDVRVDRAHNLFVDQLMTGGAIGLVALLVLLGVAIAVGWRAARQASDPWLVAALLGALAAHIAESIFAFSSATTLLVLWLVLGVLVAVGDEQARSVLTGHCRRPVPLSRRLTIGVLALALLPVIASPLVADLAYRRALAYHGGKDIRGEVAWLRRAAALAPDRQVYPVALGLALANEAVSERSAARRGRLLEEAETSARRAVALSPLDPYGHYHLGRILELRSEAEARSELLHLAAQGHARAGELSPRRTTFLDAGGRVLSLLGEPQQALERYRAAEALGGADAERTAFVGDSLLALGRADDALASYQAALGLAPRSAAAHAGLSRLLHNRGDLAGALEAARLAARFQQREWRHREWLAELELIHGDRAAALAQARAAARLAPPWERVRLQVIVERMRQGPPAPG